MLKKYLKVFGIVLITLIFPLISFAADWGVGVSTDSSGNWSVSAGVGSRGGWTLSNPYGLPSGSILGILSNLLYWLLAIFAILGIVGFIIAGIMYLVAAGDENIIGRAKTAMTYSIIGILVGLSGVVIMQAVMMLLGGVTNKF